MADDKKVTKLFWIDLEMTGLNVDKEVIIEAGVVITDIELNQLDSYHAVVKQPQKYIDGMDEWNTEHHGQSGLTALIPTGKPPEQVEQDLIALVDKHFSEERPILAGNSIGQDRRFIDKHWPKLASRLHYRLLDVTSWKIMFNNLFGIDHEKKDAHRAVDDIKESIAELKTFIGHIKT